MLFIGSLEGSASYQAIARTCGTGSPELTLLGDQYGGRVNNRNDIGTDVLSGMFAIVLIPLFFVVVMHLFAPHHIAAIDAPTAQESRYACMYL